MARNINAWWTDRCRKMNENNNIIISIAPSAPKKGSCALSAPLIADANELFVSMGNLEGKVMSDAPSSPIQNSIASPAPLIADANDANQPFATTGNSEGNVVADESTVRSWMQNNVELPEYTKVFIENGFDRMSMFETLAMEDLNLMGISKLGHRKKIMSEVAKLKGDVSIEIVDEAGYIPGAAGSSSISDPPPAFHSEL